MNSPPAIRVSHVSKKFARSLKRAMTYGLIDIARAALIPHRFRSDHLSARLSDAEKLTTEDTETRRKKGTTDHTDFTDNNEERRTKNQELPTKNEEPRTKNQEPRTKNQEPRTKNQEPRTKNMGALRPSEFWALRDVSFDIQPGECVGLIGANGAGKSTLFSILSGIYGPTEGRIEIRGRLQALIALGAGFHPMLTGRENVYINAAILGMNAAEVNKRLDAILDFADIGEFIDAPIKTYSSGMLVRLGFAVAAHMDPDVMLIDEILAVGDAAFQRKCTDFSMRLVNSGKTIMTVSHNPIFIQTMCSRAIWLERGVIREEGEVEGVVQRYRAAMLEKALRRQSQDRIPAQDGCPVSILDVAWLSEGSADGHNLVQGQPATLRIELQAHEKVDCARVWVQVFDENTMAVATGCSMYDDGHFMKMLQGRTSLFLEFPALSLRPDKQYFVRVGIRDVLLNGKIAETFQTQMFQLQNGIVPCNNGLGLMQRVNALDSLVDISYKWIVDGSVLL